MHYLLDTETLVTYLTKPESLLKEILTHIKDPKNHIYASTVSIWEIAEQMEQGHNPLGDMSLKDFVEALYEEKSGLKGLPLCGGAIVESTLIPKQGHNPFKHMIIFQAIYKGFNFISGGEIRDLG